MKNEGAFARYVDDVISKVTENFAASLEADALGIPYVPIHVFPKILRYQFRVLEDFTYVHSDQDPNHGVYSFKRDEIINLRTMADDYFMPDRSKLKFMGIIET